MFGGFFGEGHVLPARYMSFFDVADVLAKAFNHMSPL